MTTQASTPLRQPVLFLGHGSPMNAIEDNRWSRAFISLAAELPRPRAILSISAHWFIAETALTDDVRPKTIHDFGGFPPELYAMQYPAPGDRSLAAHVAQELGPDAQLLTDWGLDHGTWSVLCHLFPRADVPVVQLAIDSLKQPAEHLALGRKLRSLRDEGVLILGSGNITHNLKHAFQSMHRGDTTTPEWASRFDSDIANAIKQRDDKFLLRALSTPDGRLAHPSADHYLPLLYSYGATDEKDIARYPIQGFDFGSLSMRAALWAPGGDD